MQLSIIGGFLLTISAILFAGKYISTAIAGLGNSTLDINFTQPLFIWNLFALISGIIFIFIDLIKIRNN